MARNRIKGLTIEIGADTVKLTRALGEVNVKTRETSKELKDINKMLKFDPKNTELLTQKQKALSEQVNATREKLDKLKEAEKQAQEQFKKGEISEQQYRALKREVIDTESKLKYYEKQLEDATSKQAELNRKLEEASKNFKNVGEKMGKIGGELTKKVTAPLVGVGVASAKLGIDFERSMSEVQAVTSATDEELAQLEKTAREVGRTTNKSASEAADGLKLMGQAGWNVAESQTNLEKVVKLSSTGNIELSRATDLLVNGLATMGKTSEETDRYLDILAKTSNATNTDIEGLGDAFISVGGRFRTLNVDIDEGATALGVLATAGKTGSEAGKSLNAVLANLTAPTGRAKKALDELGVSAFDSQGNFLGIEETLRLVENSMDGMTTEQKNMYISMIAGKEHTDTFTALMGGLDGTFESLTKEVKNADGSLDEMYKTITGDTKGSIENLKSSLEDLMISIYKGLQPTIEKIVGWIQKLTDKFNGLSPSQQENIVKIGMLVASIGPLLKIGSKWILGISKVIGIIQAIIPIIATLAGAISWPVVAIGAVIAVGVLLIKNWDLIKAKGTELKNSIFETFENIRNTITNKINNARDAVFNAIEKIKSFFKFKWSLPPLKIPKFRIDGEFGLNPPRVPKFKIDWHADGAIFTKPTIFNTPNGFHGVGEAGSEAVLPISKLNDIIADSLAKTGTRNTTIVVENMQVRNDRDIQLIAYELDRLRTDVHGTNRKMGIAYGGAY